jgi:hypothetical protein
MTLKDMNLRSFELKPIPHNVFQPHFEPWFDWHTQFNSLPRETERWKFRQLKWIGA